MDSETKYNVASCLVVISILSCSMSLIAMYIAIPQIPNNTYDYNDGLVTILSVLVTLLIGWNIYTVVDFNRKTEKMEEKVKKEIQETKDENKKLKDDYLSIKKDLEHMQSDITFTSVLNYAMKMDNGNFTQHAIDGYMDALYVAVKDGLEADRKEVAIKSLHKIFVEYKDTLKQECPILPEKRNLYYSILSIVEPKDEKIRYLENFLLENTIDRYEGFPSGHIRIMSDYNPDSPHTKS